METHKLDMMAEISSLKIKLATSEKYKRELEERLFAAQRHILDLEARLPRYESDYRQRNRHNGGLSPNMDSSESEVEKLKRAVDTLVLSNDEKERRLEDMARYMRRYKKVEDYLIQSQGQKLIDEILSADDDSANSSLTPSTGYESAAKDKDNQILTTEDKTYHDGTFISGRKSNLIRSPTDVTPKRRPLAGLTRSNSCEDITPQLNKTSRSLDRRGDSPSYHTPAPNDNGMLLTSLYRYEDKKHAAGSKYRGSSKKKAYKLSLSAPNLGATIDGYGRNGHISGHGSSEVKKKRGLRRLFGKLRRSTSTDLENDYPQEFKRGGIRATAGARLAWSRDLKSKDDFSQPFSRWDCDKVMAWLYNIGLNMYVTDCKRWVRNGDQLLKATNEQLIKEMDMRNSLHRKKLQLAMQAVTSTAPDKYHSLDHYWVTGWLDDIGLPQYKEAFFLARVDARVLNSLTVDDLFTLKITNSLHHLSIRRGIHVLRANGFNLHQLCRRPSTDEKVPQHGIPDKVTLWTNHRVMEWLRTIDLSEYAPNLRGSGVHGALMVLEPRFTAELFSMVLSIPQNKTLLRRHLKIHFVSLIGNDVQQSKREMEASPHYIPLLPNTKVKQRKFGLFPHRRSKSDTDFIDYLCPFDTELPSLPPPLTNGHTEQPKTPLQTKPIYIDSKTSKEIGNVSKEIASMTNRLNQGHFIDNVQTSTV